VTAVVLSTEAYASASSTSDGSDALAIGISSESAVSSGDDVRATKFGSTAASDTTSATTESVSSASTTSSRTPLVVKKLGPTDTGQTAGFSQEDGTLVLREDQGWKTGSASAYTLEDNDGWDATASGVKLTEDSMTVAVPSNRLDLLGKTCEIYYGGKTVTATVTDTGGFAPLGRDLDLAGGVWKALGASSTGDWGVRTVTYRFL
jgi:3D (Asp-Asp-Asp) domain-containing protein